jgi:hypothetical protein
MQIQVVVDGGGGVAVAARVNRKIRLIEGNANRRHPSKFEFYKPWQCESFPRLPGTEAKYTNQTRVVRKYSSEQSIILAWIRLCKLYLNIWRYSCFFKRNQFWFEIKILYLGS